jgi:hypothetical protein
LAGNNLKNTSQLLKLIRVRDNLERQAAQLLEKFEDKLRLKEERAKKVKQYMDDVAFDR